jgi:hypothetical protein
MHKFPLENAYALRSYLRLSERKYFDEMTVIPLKNESMDSFINITNSSVYYVIVNKEMTYRYDCYASYADTNIYSLSEYVYYLNPESSSWHQTIESDDNNFVKRTREQIRIQLQNAFRHIDTGWHATDLECIQSPSWYAIISRFNQCSTPKTRRILREYIKGLKKAVVSGRFRKKKIVHKVLFAWKEWYFDPKNQGGYLRGLRKRYLTRR